MTRAYIPATLRQQVYERAEGRCAYCLIPETVTLTTHQVDHIVALKQGGLTEGVSSSVQTAPALNA